MSPRQMKTDCQIDSDASGYLEHGMEEINFSARAHDRILKVACNLADLAGAVNPVDRCVGGHPVPFIGPEIIFVKSLFLSMEPLR
jgi:Magnesium chelatase, subunit ChlI C-terminal